MTDKEQAHDIELPPLPDAEAYLYINGKHRGVSLDYHFDADLSEGTRRIALISAEQAEAYARAAVEADRKLRGMSDETVKSMGDAFIQQTDKVREETDYASAQPQPKRHLYNASGSLSEYGIFPECDAR